MIDKLAIKLYINGCTGCIVTTGRYSTFLLTVDPPVAKKKTYEKFENFFSLYTSCQMRKTNCPLNNNPRCFMYTVCTKKYVPNFQENYEKIRKRFNESTFETWKKEETLRIFTLLLFFFHHTSERRRKGRESNPVHATREPQQFDDRGWRGESNAVLLAEL